MTSEEIERVALEIGHAPGCGFVSRLGQPRTDSHCRCGAWDEARRAIAGVEQILRDRPLPDDLTELERMYQDAVFNVQLLDEKIKHVRLQMKLDKGEL